MRPLNKRQKRAKEQYVSRRYKCNLIHIWEPVFQSNYYYVIADTFKEFNEIIKKEFNIVNDEDKAFEPTGHCTCFKKDEGTLVFIWTRDQKPETIAHECLHALNFELDSRGIKFDLKNDELWAYMLMFLIREINKHLKT